tara:strand:+ start:97 stop:618 length:522 start_codon:yes stop_codon:yes gene_type:complete
MTCLEKVEKKRVQSREGNRRYRERNPDKVAAARKRIRTPEYIAWEAMKHRCSMAYHSPHLYHDRGISVCPEWYVSFVSFLYYIGPHPGGRYSLDRINNERGYEPGNVRWARWEVQSTNKRNIKITPFDVVPIRSDERLYRIIAAQYGVSITTISEIKRGKTWGHVSNDALRKG